ncbi:hypothetical protein LRR81_16580 [Metabacillus sp. GX 13764]|uniref:hypothetical protein n=1 Tax=Metabacillus kandeliae TaxID=2900151 RepID=UPI001E45AE67|nr:hypothetical protein [Metabacillus kandeliae]MCD7035861.1 hypothetical protein [Metabacillus kandeliae]
MNMDAVLMMISYVLSLFHFLYSYKEILRISGEAGKVNGWPLIFSAPSAILFACSACYFYERWWAV